MCYNQNMIEAAGQDRYVNVVLNIIANQGSGRNRKRKPTSKKLGEPVMKVTKLEWAALAVTGLTLVAMLFYFWGSRSLASPVTISAREAETSAATSQIAAQGENGDTEEESGEDADVFPIDLNTATKEELMLLPNIGEVRAEAIVAYREEHGPFQYVEDLVEVKGIGEGILEDLMDYVTIS